MTALKNIYQTVIFLLLPARNARFRHKQLIGHLVCVFYDLFSETGMKFRF